jgi:hypothetical protein
LRINACGDDVPVLLALQLLVDAGADVERARVIRAQEPQRRVIGIGGAVLGGPLPTRDR